tara:strand:- start:621 stop:1472 length:852 start_codon:yes stop_codon:yes gene_type:complete
MQLINFKVPDNYDVYLLSDIHLGVIFHNTKAFDQVIKKIQKKKTAYVIILGDLVEGRPLGHRFFNLDSADPEMLLPINQYKAFKKKIEPIKKKIITILEGNHDRQLSKQYGNMTKEICKDLNIPFGTFSSVITFRDKVNPGAQQFKIYCTHGAGTINSSAGDIIRREGFMLEAIKRRLKNKVADCMGMFMGHTHKLMVAEPRQRLYLVSDGNKIQQVYSKIHGNSKIISEDDRWYGNTGSFLKTNILGISTYSEEAMYDPLETGYLIMHCKNREIESIEKVVV